MNALRANTDNVHHQPGTPNKLSNHVTINYLEPFIGDIYSKNNMVTYVNSKDNGGCVTGDLVEWTKNYVGEEYLSQYKDQKFVKVKFPKDCKVRRDDKFECLTKAPFLVNDKIKFIIHIYKKTGEKEVDRSYYDSEALKLLEESLI